MHPRALNRPALKNIIVFAGGLALSFAGERSRADSISPPPSGAEAHATVCPCGQCCRQESCGGGGRSTAPDLSALSRGGTPFHQGKMGNGPCVCPVPCGDTGVKAKPIDVIEALRICGGEILSNMQSFDHRPLLLAASLLELRVNRETTTPLARTHATPLEGSDPIRAD